MTEPNNSLERQQNVSSEITAQREAIQKAKDQIASKFQELRKKIRTPAAEYDESVVLMVLQNPLNQLQKEIEAEIKNGDGTLKTETLDAHGKKIRDAVDIATAYLEKMTAETGGITPEILVKMTRDINKKASRFADLLVSGKNRDLLDAYRAAIGNTDQSTDLPTEEKRAVETVIDYLNKEFDNEELMSYVWSILAFMKKDLRLETAKKYSQGKKPDKINKFLQKGNEMGAFSLDEMQEIDTAKKYTPEEQQKALENWKFHNDFRVEATKLAIIPYGTESTAGKMLTIPNLLLGFIKFGAGVSIVGNFVTGAWSGGKFRGFGEAVKRLTNAPSLFAAATYATVKVFESKDNLAEILKGKKPEQEAKQALLREKKGNARFPAWNAFFKSQDFAGAQVFFDYLSNLKTIYDETDIAKLQKHLTPAKFSEFLGKMAARKDEDKNLPAGKTGLPAGKAGYDYTKLKGAFDEIKTSEILTFAKIFDTLNIGGVNAQDQYTQALREDSSVA